jgi:hypothetical protein
LDTTIIISFISAFLSFTIAYEANKAYKFTKKDYLLNFGYGFLLLGLSYIVLIPLAAGVNLPGNFQDADDLLGYPVVAIMETIAFALIAIGYSQTKRSKQFLFGLVGLLFALVFTVLLPQSYVPLSMDILLHFLNTCLLAYVLYHMLKVLPSTDLVFSGFLLLGLHEYTSLIGSITEAFSNSEDDVSFTIASLLRLAGLAMLFASFLLASRRIPSKELEEIA